MREFLRTLREEWTLNGDFRITISLCPAKYCNYMWLNSRHALGEEGNVDYKKKPVDVPFTEAKNRTAHINKCDSSYLEPVQNRDSPAQATLGCGTRCRDVMLRRIDRATGTPDDPAALRQIGLAAAKRREVMMTVPSVHGAPGTRSARSKARLPRHGCSLSGPRAECVDVGSSRREFIEERDLQTPESEVMGTSLLPGLECGG
ncbi:hypothetical protein CSIM01_07865 [Colletotrichum simmondsii]|uniref:Uncharacterized protein n=1 Tax=Colletotrichum simmondsii TaxID=703756 RepID=A0A135TV39_9PEZI|nr:hypothetical protein CSIM01_07865 [Colletotrichum simmondsii]